MTTQIAVKLPDEMVALVDELVSEGAFPSRSAAVKRGLEAILKAHQNLTIDRAYATGYAQTPETQAELKEAMRLSIESIEEEPWEKWW